VWYAVRFRAPAGNATVVVLMVTKAVAIMKPEIMQIEEAKASSTHLCFLRQKPV
jgi:hypothetical protein